MADDQDFDNGELLAPIDGGAELVPQEHGGSIYRGWPAHAAAKGVSMRAAKKRMRQMMLDASEENMTKLIEICRGDDRRAAVVALKEYYDRFLGKANEHGFGHDDDSGASIDLSRLPKEHQDEVMHCLRRITELTGVGADSEDGG